MRDQSLIDELPSEDCLNNGNPCRYVHNSPPNATDPTGLAEKVEYDQWGRPVDTSSVYTGTVEHRYQHMDQWGRPVYDIPLCYDTPERAQEYREQQKRLNTPHPAQPKGVPSGYTPAAWGDVVVGHYKTDNGSIPVTKPHLTLKHHVEVAMDAGVRTVLLTLTVASPGSEDEILVVAAVQRAAGQSERIVLNAETTAALRGTGLSDVAISRYLDVLEDVHVFRGTTEGFPGNPALERLGLTPTSIDPVVASSFAAEGAAKGGNPIIMFGPRTAFGDSLGVGNVRSVMEREVTVGLAPTQFANTAPRSISLDRARSILAEMEIDIPPTVNNVDELLRNSNRMTPDGIKLFIQKASQ